jgi:hypothetical protein
MAYSRERPHQLAWRQGTALVQKLQKPTLSPEDGESQHKQNKEDHDKNVEQHARDVGARCRNSGEAQQARNDRDSQKYQSPF